jgi:hypothetical protein
MGAAASRVECCNQPLSMQQAKGRDGFTQVLLFTAFYAFRA